MATIPKLIRKLGKEAYNLYIVGGYIRDRILNREAKDYDFVVQEDAEKIAKLAAEKLGVLLCLLWRKKAHIGLL